MPSDKVYHDRNLQIIFGITLMAVLGVSSVAPALPTIMQTLQISHTQVALLISVYTLPGIFLSPVAGILSDRVGRKRLVVPALFFFGITGGACALTTSLSMLLVLRAFQGFSAAILGTLNLTLIGDLFSGTRRAEAMGINASILSFGTFSYPLIGGTLATFAWNYPFLMPLVAIPVGFLALRYLNNPEPKSQGSLTSYLSGAWSYLKDPKVQSVFLLTVIGFGLLYGVMITYNPLYLNSAFGASPFTIGIISASMSLVTALVASQLGRLAKVFSMASLMKLGFLVMALPMAAIPLIPNLGLEVLPVVVWGAGWAIVFPAVQVYLTTKAPPEYRAIFMALNGTTLYLGQTIGPVFMGMAFTLGGYEAIYFSGAAVALLVAAVGFIGGRIMR
ncbi:MAG: MFS transporter [Chloroflexota bacterium]